MHSGVTAKSASAVQLITAHSFPDDPIDSAIVQLICDQLFSNPNRQINACRLARIGRDVHDIGSFRMPTTHQRIIFRRRLHDPECGPSAAGLYRFANRCTSPRIGNARSLSLAMEVIGLEHMFSAQWEDWKRWLAQGQRFRLVSSITRQELRIEEWLFAPQHASLERLWLSVRF